MEKHNLPFMDLGRFMHEIFRVFKKRIGEQTVEDIKITTEQFGLLHAIHQKEEEVIQKDMAEMTGKDKSVILRLIDSLEEKELVRRVVDKSDRRKNCLMVTKLGERVIKQYKKIALEILQDVKKGLSDEDIDSFNRVLSRLQSNAQKL